MGVSIAKQDAVVTNLVGQLKAKDEQGNVRDVTIGDLIKNGEQLIFSPNAQFILEMADGSVVDETSIISEEPSLSPSPEEGLATAPVSTDAEIAALQAQILAGEDPTAGLPETAAGTAAGAGGNEGTDFITLDRTADETIAGSGYDTSGFELAAAAAVDEPIIAEENILPTLTSSSITVSEINLPQGSTPLASALSQANTITLAAPNGISLVLINGVEVFIDGVFAGPTTITSVSGALNITGYDAETGILSYTYTLNSAVDHSAADLQADTFNVSLTDILGNNTTSSITANLLDDAPSGQDDTGNIGEDDVSVSGSVIDNDTQGADSATVSQITNSDGASLAVAQPTSINGGFGILQISADGSYSYLLSTQLDVVQSLAQGEQVTDTFTYQLTDSDGDSVPVTLTLTITGTNDTPVITPEIGDGADQGTVIESGNEDDGTIVPGVPQTTGTLTATDIDNGAVLSWSGSAAGTLGSFVIDATSGQWSYTLDNQLADNLAEGSVSQEEFLVTVTDEFGATATQLVTITINGTNDSPVITSSAADATGSVNEQPAEGVVLAPDTQVASGTLTAGDVDTGAVLTWSGDTDSPYGSFSIDPVTGEWTYTLNNQAAESLAEGEVVQESFLVTVIDEFGATDTQTVTINITGTDEATLIANDTNTIDEDTVALGNVLDNDSDEDDLLTVSSFTVEGNSYSAGTSVDLENGTLVLNSDGSYVFTPDANWNGNVPIVTYTTNTGATATLTIIVEPVNDAPDALNNSYNLNEGGFTSGNIITDNTGSGVDSDIDGGALSITHINGVAVTFIAGTAIIPIGDGTLTINQNGSFTYAHNSEEPEPTSFTYTINDGLGGTDTASVFLNINPVNDGPFAEDDSFSVDESALLGGNVISHIDNNDGLLDSDGGDGGPLSITQVNGVDLAFGIGGWSQDIAVGNGTLRIQADGTFEYQHDGSDPEETPPSFEYTLSDGTGTDTAVVTITINPVNDGPFAEDDSFSVDEGALLGGNVITHIDNNDGLLDSDGGDGGPLSITQVNGIDLLFGLDGWSQDIVVGNGTLRIKADGTFEYQHDGSDPEDVPPTFQYTLSDGSGTDTAVVTITTNPVNDGPEIVSIDPAAVSEEGLLYGLKDTDGQPDDTTNEASFVGTLSFTDVDSSSFGISIDDTNIGQYYSGSTEIIWNWSGNTLTGTAGSMTVMTIVFGAVSGTAPDFSVNYTVTLFAPINHDPESNIEDVLPIAFAVTVDDQNGGTADTSLTVKIEDDSPVDDVDTEALQTISNTIGQYITGDLFSPGADGFGGVSFNVATQGLLYNGIALTYTMFGNTLKAMAHDTEVFTLTAVPDGNGHYDYKLVLLQEIQLEYTIDYNLSDAPAGNNAAYYVNVDGEIYAKDDLASEVIATITGTGSVNSNSHGIGIGPKTSIDDGEAINFYYGTNGTSVAAISLGTGNNGEPYDGTSYITYIINYVGGGQQIFTNVLVDGTFTIEAGPLNGFNIESINIAHVNEDDFQVIEVSSAGSITEQPIDIDFTYTATDADGDNVFDPDGEPGGFTVIVEPNTGNDDINILAGTDAGDTLLGGIESDYIIGGTGDDTISGGAGADILIGSEGSDTIDAGIDSDRDAITWEVGSADDSIDTIYNFNPVYDVLNLSDVLVNEAPGDLEDFLSFNFVGGSTEITLDTNGTSTAGGDTLTILLDGVDLSTIYGPSPTEIINGLLDDDALIVDVP